MNNKPRVLLATQYSQNDLGKLAWGENIDDMHAARLERGHGVFQIKSLYPSFGLHLLAENVSNPTTVLERPDWNDFERELDEGYDYVGLQLKNIHMKKIAKMMRCIREKSPNAKIIVGGYGVGALDIQVPGDVDGDAIYIRETADHLCREEGVRFLRSILNDEPIDREITQYQLPGITVLMPAFGAQMSFPGILVSLGCPNACDFCCTSAMFHHKKIYVAEPEQVYRFMKHYQKVFKRDALTVMLYDEDLFQNVEYVRELGRLIRSDKKTWPLSYSTFGSMQSLSQFDMEELRDCGVKGIWVGVESFASGPEGIESIYEKRKGRDIKEMFEKLHRNGISTIGSLMLGLDFHTRENLKQDIDKFVDLKPGRYQISPIRPCPGTELYDKLLGEGRILEACQWDDFHIWSDGIFKPENLDNTEIKELYDYAHKQLSDINGPPFLQDLENVLNCYQQLKKYTDECHIYEAKRAKIRARAFYSLLRSIKLHHTSEVVRERAEMLEMRLRREIGNIPLWAVIASFYLSVKIRKASGRKTPAADITRDVRWTYYHRFDERAWVKEGRGDNKPEPYYVGSDSKIRSFFKFLFGKRVTL